MSEKKRRGRAACPHCGKLVVLELAGEQMRTVCPNCQLSFVAKQRKPRANSRDPLLGTVLGSYRIVERVGRGGVGAVYRAEEIGGGRTVALKVLLPVTMQADDTQLRRFMREARVSGQLQHPNIVQCYDAGQELQYFYIAMEFVDGPNLEAVLRQRSKLPPPRALDIALQCARGLEAAHHNDMIHRDIKPSNLLIDREGVVKISDFGLAKSLSDGIRITQVGRHLGTPYYVSPEQCTEDKLDIRSDIYSLGVTLFEMLAGRRPYEAGSAAALMRQHLEEPVPSLLREASDIPSSVALLVEKMMAKAPQDRFQSPEELIEAMEWVMERVKEVGAARGTEPRPPWLEKGWRGKAALNDPARVQQKRGRACLVAIVVGEVVAAAAIIYFVVKWAISPFLRAR